MNRTLLATVLTATALVTPAAATGSSAIGQDLVYSVSASHPSGAGRLDATCTFRPDRWTADYGPTVIDAVATTAGVANSTSVRCEIYSWGSLAGAAQNTANGPAVTIQGKRVGPVATRPHIRVCVSASTQYVVDIGYTVSRCVTP